MSDTVIPEEARKMAREAAFARWVTGSSDSTQMLMSVDAALTAALPALRHQWAEEVATKLEERERRSREVYMPHTADTYGNAADAVREYGETTP